MMLNDRANNSTKGRISTLLTLTFNISYLSTQRGQDLYISGNSVALSNWNTANVIKLTTNP